MTARDPRTAPRAGDFLVCGETLVRVDSVSRELGEVLVAVFHAGSMRPADRPVAVRMAEWIEATREAGVVELQPDDPRHTAMILEARA